MKEIPLTKGKVAIVDDDDYEAMSAFKWHFDGRGYAVRIFGSPKFSSIKMHRAVLGVTDSTIFVDHINGNKLDNRRSNLRTCTKSQNACNKWVASQNTSGFKGVSWNKCAGKWQASIKLKQKLYFLGNFSTPEAAHEAYKAAAIKMHGEFANFGDSAK